MTIIAPRFRPTARQKTPAVVAAPREATLIDRDGSGAPGGGASPLTDRHNDGGRDTIRVLLADDHKILRQGLASLLEEEEDIQVVGEADDGAMAVELAMRTRPDVIVMDITMPRMSGIEATRRITGKLPDVRVIGLSMHTEADMAAAIRAAGAATYLTKGGPSEALIAAIRGDE